MTAIKILPRTWESLTPLQKFQRTRNESLKYLFRNLWIVGGAIGAYVSSEDSYKKFQKAKANNYKYESRVERVAHLLLSTPIGFVIGSSCIYPTVALAVVSSGVGIATSPLTALFMAYHYQTTSK